MEYGSDFYITSKDFEEAQNNIIQYLKNYNTFYFDSGRSGLKYITSKGIYKNIVLPGYLCDSIIECFKESNIVLYPVGKDLKISLKALEKIDWEHIDLFYLLHYFGAVQPEDVLQYILEKKKKYNFVVIEDTSHSIFSKKRTIGDYCICSLRKWFAIPDGAVLYSLNDLKTEDFSCKRKLSNRADAMFLKGMYLSEGIDCKELFRALFLSTEAELDKQEEIFRISFFSEMLLNCQDLDGIINIRRDNYRIMERMLADEITNYVKLDLDSEVPLAFVALLENRDRLRSYLIKKKIYCAVHWPMPEQVKLQNSLYLSQHLMSFPIDQRYREEDMEIIGDYVKGFYKNEQI